jgi:hypothetical protein
MARSLRWMYVYVLPTYLTLANASSLLLPQKRNLERPHEASSLSNLHNLPPSTSPSTSPFPTTVTHSTSCLLYSIITVTSTVIVIVIVTRSILHPHSFIPSYIHTHSLCALLLLPAPSPAPLMMPSMPTALAVRHLFSLSRALQILPHLCITSHRIAPRRITSHHRLCPF